jgi:hypothetical protein
MNAKRYKLKNPSFEQQLIFAEPVIYIVCYYELPIQVAVESDAFIVF